MSATFTVDQSKLEAIVGQAVADFGATISSALVVIGDKLGLYKALAGAGPLTPTELAVRTETDEHYVHPWLVNQAAGGYVEYDPATGRYTLSPEQAVALTDETSPFYVGGGFQVMTAAIKAEPRIAEAFKTGGGLVWGEQDAGLGPKFADRLANTLPDNRLVRVPNAGRLVPEEAPDTLASLILAFIGVRVGV